VPNQIRDFVFVLLPVMVLLGTLPFFYKNELLLFNFIIYFALAQGLNVIYGFTGYLPFGYVGFFGVGAYGFALTIIHLSASPALAMAIAGFSALVLGVILIPLLRLSGAYFAIANLAAAQAVYHIVSNPDLQDITKGPYGVSLANVFAPKLSYYSALAIAALASMVVIWFRNSRFGLALQAIRDDPLSAAMAGIPMVRERTIAWLISALIAGLTGGVFAWHISVFYPETAFDISISIFALVFALFGGATTLLGPMIGVLLLYGLYNIIGITIPQYFQLIYGVLIVVLVLFLPQGIVSLVSRRGIRVP